METLSDSELFHHPVSLPFMEGFFNGMRLVLEVQRLSEALEIFLLRCIPCGLTLQEDDVVVKSKNPVILTDEVIQLSEVSLQTFALLMNV